MEINVQEELDSILKLNLESVPIENIVMKLGHIIQPFLVHVIGAEFKTLYRARINERTDELYTNLSEVWYPGSKYVNKLGRFNNINESVFYASVHHLGALLECQPKDGDIITIAICEKKSSRSLKVANLFLDDLSKDKQFEINVESIQNNTAAQLLLKTDRQKKDHILIQSFFQKQLLQAVKHGEEYKYKTSIAIRDVFFAIPDLDGLFYPSLALDKKNINFILRPSAADFHYLVEKIIVLKYNQFVNMAECIAKSLSIDQVTGEIIY